MMLADDSPLRRLPPDTEPRLVSLLDGIRYSIDMVDLSYGRLRQGLAETHKRFEAGLPAPAPPGAQHPIPTLLYAAAFSDAWTIIDAADRLRRLIPHLPKNKQ